MSYIYTLDSHDCYGPFDNAVTAIRWADRSLYRSPYQVLVEPPYTSTPIITPKACGLCGRLLTQCQYACTATYN